MNIHSVAVAQAKSRARAQAGEVSGRSARGAALFAELAGAVGAPAAGAHVQLWIAGDFRGRQAEVASEDVGRQRGHPARLVPELCR